jgi:hypothetical protein
MLTLGVASESEYWSTARSGGKDGLGLISEKNYWSTARSGGKDGLGLVTSPMEINRTMALGIVPNDKELSTFREYLPVHHGWIVGKDRTYWGGNLGDAASVAAATGSDYALVELVRAERLKARMAVVSAVAGAILAGAALAALIARGSQK